MGQKALWGELSEEQVGCKKMALTNVCHSSPTGRKKWQNGHFCLVSFGLRWEKPNHVKCFWEDSRGEVRLDSKAEGKDGLGRTCVSLYSRLLLMLSWPTRP
jgi:hypothetical protein